MPELIDKQATLKKMCESCGYCDRFEKAMRTTHPDFVTIKCNIYNFLAAQPAITLGLNKDNGKKTNKEEKASE